ncbi:GNAT family N-acetyltransferase [Nocardioides sp. zg-DK7169]|uniref:GNAT family N-acetyltransferase n=1 Tax=Nocardioides sp. zg-DK7169 TaxID=2736600 RepID=UPI0015552214|nr:GNAT family N-acetyltransferase [Nocardioides sp. zg-DK7169]NPC96511.1 GNAT family N-acetyltransferase [Nocardioides sp. zg-DK7169]
MTQPPDVRALDLEDPATLSAVYAVECSATAHARPGWVPLDEAARAAAWQADNGWSHHLVGTFEGDDLIGFASSSTADDTPDTSWLDVCVLPTHQRRGIGTRLARAAEQAGPAGAERYVASAYLPTATEIDALVERFAGPLGYARATTETVVELDLATAELAPAEPGAADVTVSTHLDGVPADLRAQVGVIKGLVDAEAPHGELGWEPTPVSVEDYERELALWHQQGRTPVESIAVTADGVVAAWTCVVVGPTPQRPAHVEGTLVLTAHRGAGLGRAVKVASLLAVREHAGAVRVRTSSDDANVWMRAINADLGFSPVESEVLLQKVRRPVAR